MKETGIDCMKYRKSTHLASVDIDSIISEKGKCLLTIKEAYFAKGIDVSGNKTDGYFLEFEEDVKPMVANSTNRMKIAKIIKENKGLNSVESRNIGNWIGWKIELIVDNNVKMMGQVVDGIRVIETIELPILTKEHPKFKAVKDAIISGQYDIEQVRIKYQVSKEIEQLILKK
jgi:hypothetical protein